MASLFMISFIYGGHTFYANVIVHKNSQTVYHISILTSKEEIPRRLILIERDGQLTLSNYSLPANAELIKAISDKLINHAKSEVA
jgi:hypothetical protein